MIMINTFFAAIFSNTIFSQTIIYKKRFKYNFYNYFCNLMIYLYLNLKKNFFIYKNKINYYLSRFYL